jgi:hypothetical protein
MPREAIPQGPKQTLAGDSLSKTRTLEVVFTAEQGKLLNRECAVALSSVLRKVTASNPDLHAQFTMSNCKIALRYLQYIHQIAIDGYSPIAVSLFRTYYEIVCSTMYLAEHKDELDDFLKFGRLMYFEIGQLQKAKGKLLNQLVPDHTELREYFLKKKHQHGGKLLSRPSAISHTTGLQVPLACATSTVWVLYAHVVSGQ